MAVIWPVIAAVVGIALGIAVGLFIQQTLRSRRIQAAEKDAEQIVAQAVMKQKEILLEAKDESLRLKQEREVEYRDRRAEMQRQEKRISQKEENLDHKSENQERRERNIVQKEREAENARAQVEEFKKKQVQQLELISKMSTEEARNQLLQTVETEVRDEMNRRLHELEIQFKADAEQKSREILATAIQRCATDVVSESTVSVVPLPSDEMKGRLIGREGRNIRALENATGVDLIIDDTPETVTISSFDPVRREVARVALTKLITDGRIHPARIEEVVQKAKNEVDATVKEEGEQAAYKAGVAALHPELIKLVGRLKFRFSYGQNVLAHSLEVSYLAGVIASELGADVEKAKVAGLLHDIGKAVSHEVEGPHAAIGADIIKRLGRSPEVVQAVGEHHGESGTNSVLGYIIATADAISGSRPGARRESLEHYIKRLEALESVANSFKGVEKSFAIQAGREVRIMVKPDEVDDMAAFQLARDIVKKIEDSLEYPGQIKVTVVRETRAVDYAK